MTTRATQPFVCATRQAKERPPAKAAWARRWWRQAVGPTVLGRARAASFYAPHVGCPESERLAFWQRLSNSIGDVLQALPGVDVILAGDSNLWVPGLVQACPQRSADRSCLVSLRLCCKRTALKFVTHLIHLPTHVVVIASPGVVDTVSVHHRACNCSSAGLCCPVLSSDAFCCRNLRS